METHLSEFWRSTLHRISITGTFLVLFGSLTLIQMLTIGIFFDLNEIWIGNFPISFVTYMCISTIIIKKNL